MHQMCWIRSDVTRKQVMELWELELPEPTTRLLKLNVLFTLHCKLTFWMQFVLIVVFSNFAKIGENLSCGQSKMLNREHFHKGGLLNVSVCVSRITYKPFSFNTVLNILVLQLICYHDILVKGTTDSTLLSLKLYVINNSFKSVHDGFTYSEMPPPTARWQSIINQIY